MDVDLVLNETVDAFPVTAWDMLTESSDRIRENCGAIGGLMIPPLQRKYTWGAREAVKMIEDIIAAPQGSAHYLGELQVNIQTKNRRRIFEVLAGQQRLTTLLIWYYSAYKYMVDNSEEDLLIEPELKAERISYLTPILNKEETQLTTLPNVLSSIKEISYVEPEEKPEITEKKIGEVFNAFMKWWEMNPVEHPDTLVREALDSKAAFLLIVAPRFSAPRRFVDQSKTVPLNNVDKLVAAMLDANPDTYRNTIASSVELAWMRDHIDPDTELENSDLAHMKELMSKWEIEGDLDTDQGRTQIRRAIIASQMQFDQKSEAKEVDLEVLHSIADTLGVTDNRCPMWTRKYTKVAQQDEYRIVLGPAVDAIGFGFGHSRHKDSEHEGTNKSNMFSKSLGIKGDEAIERIAAYLTHDPEPVKERLQRADNLLKNIIKRYTSIHSGLIDHVSNVQNMFNIKQPQNVIATLAYYEGTHQLCIDASLQSCFMMHGWLPLLNLGRNTHENITKWESVICSVIEKSGRRDWDHSYVERMDQMTKLIIAEALYVGQEPVGCDASRMVDYIVNGDEEYDGEKSMEEILARSFAVINETDNQDNLTIFNGIEWRAAVASNGSLFGLERWAIWAASEHPELFDSNLLVTTQTTDRGPLWLPGKTKPFFKDAMSTESALWALGNSGNYRKTRVEEVAFLSFPLYQTDNNSNHEEPFANKLGFNGEADEGVLEYDGKIINVMCSLIEDSIEEETIKPTLLADNSSKKFKAVINKTFI